MLSLGVQDPQIWGVRSKAIPAPEGCDLLVRESGWSVTSGMGQLPQPWPGLQLFEPGFWHTQKGGTAAQHQCPQASWAPWAC